MNLYFEEDGAFKAGSMLSQTGNAYQIELPTGRRTKVKASHVFFSFERPAAADFLKAAADEASALDPAFLWEAAPEEEFSFDDLAKEYWGSDPKPVERAAIHAALHANPVYFYRKGRGRYRRAPADVLERALAALERKKREEEKRKAWTAEMLEGRIPEEIRSQAYALLLAPDKNGIAWKALSDAASEARMSPLRLMLKLGAVGSPWQWHVESFYRQNFPKGRGFPEGMSLPESPDAWANLPVANVRAFSIDDSDTTEVDDAASVERLPDGRTRVGIHIAAPALGMPLGGDVDLAARRRMSTVYAPGLKTTMLPEAWIGAFSLDEGRTVPCLSLYAVVDNDTFGVERTETRLERVAVEKNLRYDKIDSLVTEEAIENQTLTIPFAEEIGWLWRFAKKLQKDREEVRGRPEALGRVDWYFALEGEGEDAKIVVRGRRRGAPLDLLVAELMIFANSTWGLWLEEHGAAGIYRSQRMGRVRMSTSPGPHDGLGVIRYAWSTSPLRRYVDLVNQRQMIAVLMGDAPAYQANDLELLTIVSRFEEVHTTYRDFQTRMERYWSLRWIMQEGLERIDAIVVKGDLVRIDGLPFMQRIPGLPEDLPKGQKVRLKIFGCDLIDLIMDAKLLEVLPDEPLEVVEEDEDEAQTEAESAEETSKDGSAANGVEP